MKELSKLQIYFDLQQAQFEYDTYQQLGVHTGFLKLLLMQFVLHQAIFQGLLFLSQDNQSLKYQFFDFLC